MECRTPNCLNHVTEKARSPYCGKCRSERFRRKYRIKGLYFINKHNAKRRGIEWLITLDEWITFCTETNYHKLVGRGPDDMTIDRVKSWLPYTYDNIRMITKRENSAKASQDARDRIKHWPKGDYPDCPF